MVRIKVKKIPKPQAKEPNLLDIAYRVCYYYPQYKVEDILQMRIKRRNELLKTARSLEAERFLNLAKILNVACVLYKNRSRDMSKIMEGLEEQIWRT